MSAAPKILSNLTTEYIDHEDRIRLSGNTGSGVIIIWVTQRIVQRLIPPLATCYGHQKPPKTAAMPTFAFPEQQQGTTDRPTGAAGEWLAHAIDIARSNEQVVITFRGIETWQSATVHFSYMQLQQWMEILHETCLLAQWPTKEWPEWLTEGAFFARGQDSVVWH